MKEKIELSKKLEDEIFNKYDNLNYSIRKLEKEYPYSFTFLQKLITTRGYKQKISKNYPLIEGKMLVAICKKTGKKIYDYNNQSGAILNHIKEIYPNITIESNYIRKSIEYKTGKFWYDQYFDFVYEDQKQEKKCKYCDWTTTDIDNQSGAYEKHLKSIHEIDINEYIIDYPNENKYLKKEIISDPIICKICGEKLRILNHKHLVKHNISVYEYKQQYDINLVSVSSHDKLSKSAIEINKNMTFKKTSKPENDLVSFLEENGLEILQSKRKLCNGQEIDIIINNSDYCIEFNGCKFHTEVYGKKDKNYHLNKTKILLSKNKKLIHLFEDEWFNNNELIKTKLLHILGVSNLKSIYARKCEIKEIDSSTKNLFLEKNHIQGSDRSNIKLGLFYNNKLVSVMTFDNKRAYNKTIDHNEKIFELTRFATDNEYRVVGGASKLLKHFINNYNPQRIISFADRRWTIDSNDNLYTKLGFKLTKVLPPDYTYYNSSVSRYKRFHKFSFGKSAIKKKHPEIFDQNKTEWEMMKQLGYDRIWDCGKFKYELIQ